MSRKALVLTMLLAVVIQTAGMALSIQGNLSRDFVLTAGKVIQTQIIVKNPSDEQKGVKVYQTDLQTWADGRSDYADPGTLPRSNASWIKFSPDLLTVPPQGTGIINVTITPPTKELEGSYWSMMMVEPLDEQSPELGGKKKSGIQFIVKTRYGIHVHTLAQKNGKKKAKFLGRNLEVKDDRKMFLLDVENTGTRMFTGKSWVELYDAGGKPAGKFSAASDNRLYPGSSSRFRIDLSKVAKGKYTALCVIDAGDDQVFGARYKLEIP